MVYILYLGMLLKMNLNVRRNSSKTEIRSERGESVKIYIFILKILLYLLSFLWWNYNKSVITDCFISWFIFPISNITKLYDMDNICFWWWSVHTDGRKCTPLSWVCWHSKLKLLCCKKLDTVAKEKYTVGWGLLSNKSFISPCINYRLRRPIKRNA